MAIFGEGDSPFGALAFGKAVVVAVRIAFAFEQWNDWVAIERLHQVVAQAALVEPVLGVFAFFVAQPDAYAGHQNSFAA